MASTKKIRPEVPPTAKRLIGVPEIQERLALTEREVWRLLANGTLASVKLGRRRLVRSDELDRFIDSLTDAAS
jgi:excisionase family DNA binding protein